MVPAPIEVEADGWEGAGKCRSERWSVAVALANVNLLGAAATAAGRPDPAAGSAMVSLRGFHFFTFGFFENGIPPP